MGASANGSDLANYFIRSGILYYSQNRQGERVLVVEANPEKHITDLPLVVLIDGSTAGAAEIAAGALKDQKRATVVGEKSFGSGADQKTIHLKSGAVLILSTAKHYTPGGKVIQDEVVRNAGIPPDVEAPDDETRQDLAVESYYDDKGGSGLEGWSCQRRTLRRRLKRTTRMTLPNTSSFRKRSTKFRSIKPWRFCQNRMRL